MADEKATGTAAEALSGAGRIAAERRRQVEAEGWTPEHDDGHEHGELAWAAVCYAAPEPVRGPVWRPCNCRSAGECNHIRGIKTWGDPWPWSAEWDKRPQANEPLPARIRALEKAGALIAAEIDRLQRLSDALDAATAAQAGGEGVKGQPALRRQPGGPR